MTTYDDVNNEWKRAVPLPPVTTAEALRIAGLLRLKFARKHKLAWWMKRRRAWANTKPVTGILRNNGLQRMVHDVAHWAHDVQHKGKLKDHSHVHAQLELEMIRFVIDKGLHIPKAPEVRPEIPELDRVEAAIKRWTTKARRAATALKKLERKRKRLLRTQ